MSITKNEAKRLLKALENTEDIKRLAEVLGYVPDQLEQDIESLGDYIKTAEKVAKDNGYYGVYEIYTGDDVSYTLLERFEEMEEAEAKAEELNKKNRESFVPDEFTSISPISYKAYNEWEYYCLTHYSRTD